MTISMVVRAKTILLAAEALTAPGAAAVTIGSWPQQEMETTSMSVVLALTAMLRRF